MTNLFVHVAFHRVTSMLWHSHSWPGKAAAMTSEKADNEEAQEGDDPAFDDCLNFLRRDFRIYLDCLLLRSATPFLKKILDASPLRLRFMSELAIMVTVPVAGMTNWQFRMKIRRLVTYVYSCWGQTKCCEDLFKKLREREDLDTLNGIRAVSSPYAASTRMGTIALHNRTEFEPRADQKQAFGSGKDIFTSKKHQPSLVNYTKIVERTDWPTFSPQSSKKIYADLVVLRHLTFTDDWDNASRCWHAELFRPLTVIRYSVEQTHEPHFGYYVVLGCLCHMVVMAWRVQPIDVNQTNHQVFLLAGCNMNHHPSMLVPINLAEFEVIPANPVSPIHYWVACNKKVPTKLGVVLLQYAAPRSVLYHCAMNCFFSLGLPQLKTIASELAVDTPCITIAPTLTALIRKILTDHDGKPPSDSTIHGILALRSIEDSDDILEICDEDLLLDILEKEDVQAFKAPCPQSKLK